MACVEFSLGVTNDPLSHSISSIVLPLLFFNKKKKKKKKQKLLELAGRNLHLPLISFKISRFAAGKKDSGDCTNCGNTTEATTLLQNNLSKRKRKKLHHILPQHPHQKVIFLKRKSIAEFILGCLH